MNKPHTAILLIVTVLFQFVAVQAMANTPRSIRLDVQVKPSDKQPGDCLVFEEVTDNRQYGVKIKLRNTCDQQVIVTPASCKGDCKSEIVLPKKSRELNAYLNYGGDMIQGKQTLKWHRKDKPEIKGHFEVTGKQQGSDTKKSDTKTADVKKETTKTKVQKTSTPPATKTKPTSGKCSSTPGPSPTSPIWALVMGFVALIGVRRQR